MNYVDMAASTAQDKAELMEDVTAIALIVSTAIMLRAAERKKRNRRASSVMVRRQTNSSRSSACPSLSSANASRGSATPLARLWAGRMCGSQRHRSLLRLRSASPTSASRDASAAWTARRWSGPLSSFVGRAVQGQREEEVCANGGHLRRLPVYFEHQFWVTGSAERSEYTQFVGFLKQNSDGPLPAESAVGHDRSPTVDVVLLPHRRHLSTLAHLCGVHHQPSHGQREHVCEEARGCTQRRLARVWRHVYAVPNFVSPMPHVASVIDAKCRHSVRRHPQHGSPGAKG
jgi:hypothetical protein